MLNIFEGELEGTSKCIQGVTRVMNILREFEAEIVKKPTIYGDNHAVVEFIHCRGAAPGVRHMQLRLWYIRESCLTSIANIALVLTYSLIY